MSLRRIIRAEKQQRRMVVRGLHLSEKLLEGSLAGQKAARGLDALKKSLRALLDALPKTAAQIKYRETSQRAMAGDAQALAELGAVRDALLAESRQYLQASHYPPGDNQNGTDRPD